jgi:ribosome-binding factor A
VSTRRSRVEELLRREVAAILLRGDVRDPRLSDAASVSITGVRVSADLSSARVFVDVMAVDGNARELALRRVVGALNGAVGVFRSQVGKHVRLRRTPSLRFEADTAISTGARIEEVLAQIKAQADPTDDAE